MPDPRLKDEVGSAPCSSVLIHGSCVSRDMLSWAGVRAPRLVDYYARSSLASAYASPPVNDRFSAQLASSFQRRQVRHDFGKTLQSVVVGQDFDVLLLDFIDERFPLFCTVDGGTVTVSAELGRCGFPGALSGAIVRPFSDAHFLLWEAGWQALLARLDAAGRRHRLRVNAVWWASTEPHPSESAGQSASLETANAYLGRLYDRVALDLRPSQVLRFEPGLFEADPAHRWGSAPYHYTDAAYATMLDRLARSMECSR